MGKGLAEKLLADVGDVLQMTTSKSERFSLRIVGYFQSGVAELDKKNSDIVFDIFKQLTVEFNQTLLIVTHDESFAAGTNRVIKMEDGRIVE